MSVLFCFAQKNYGVNQDYYIYKNEQGLIVPLVYYETKNNWYASLRYNYENDQTFSLQLGKKISNQGIVSYSITPLAGMLAGKFKGLSISTKVEIETGKFSFYTEPEYCIHLQNPSENFFYNWSEFSVQAFDFFYTGIALQTIRNYNGNSIAEPGIVLGINIKNFELPLYFFRPSTSSNYFVTGIHWRLEK
jgi:hypothetical protein